MTSSTLGAITLLSVAQSTDGLLKDSGKIAADGPLSCALIAPTWALSKRPIEVNLLVLNPTPQLPASGEPEMAIRN